MDGVPTESYDYDANGNRLQVDRGASAGDVAMYDDQDRLNVYDRRGDVYSYEYDANGDLLSKTGPEGVTSYQYDLLGALQWVMLPDGTEIEYVLDPSGRRIGKKVNGVLEWGLLYQDDLNPAAQLDGDGNLVSVFVYGTRPNIPDYFTQNGRVYRIVADHLGSPRLVIDAEGGSVAERIDYGPWGQVTRRDITGPAGYVPIPFTFAGGIGDVDTGLVRFGARDYEPVTGRWTVKDPILFNGGDTNLYGYVLEDPLNRVDPSGKVGPAPILALLLGCALIGVEDYALNWWETRKRAEEDAEIALMLRDLENKILEASARNPNPEGCDALLRQATGQEGVESDAYGEVANGAIRVLSPQPVAQSWLERQLNKFCTVTRPRYGPEGRTIRHGAK